jgi:CcdB protein
LTGHAFLDVWRTTGFASGVTHVILFQSDQLAKLATVLVIPCRPADDGPDLGRLTPNIQVGEATLRASVPELAAVPRNAIKGARVGNAADSRAELVAALDLLVLGF